MTEMRPKVPERRPHIPDAAWEAYAKGRDLALGLPVSDRFVWKTALEAAWPHLYAAALRDAALALEGSLGVPGLPQEPYEFRRWLRARADDEVSAASGGVQ